MKVKLIGWTLILISLISCTQLRSLKYRSYPANPFPDIKKVAIFPFINETTTPIDDESLANVFASELVKFNGFEVIRPARVKAQMFTYAVEIGQISTVQDVINIAKALKADAVIVGSVTDYDPYFPPRIALSIQMFRVRETNVSAQDIDKLIQSASWKPFSITKDNVKNLVCAIERVYDAHKSDLHSEAEAYAGAQSDTDYAFKDGGQFLRISERFWQFVSAQMIFEILEFADAEPIAKR